MTPPEQPLPIDLITPELNPNFNLQAVKNTLATATPQEQMRYIMENVFNGKAKCQFIDQTPFTEPINMKGFVSAADLSYVQDPVNILKQFLSFPIITDGFGDNHGDITEKTGRRGWRDQMEKVFGAQNWRIYENNKLRWNKVSHLYEATDMLLMVLPDYPQAAPLVDTAQKFKRTLQKLVPNELTWSKTSTEEKISTINAVSTALVEMLTLFNQETKGGTTT